MLTSAPPGPSGTRGGAALLKSLGSASSECAPSPAMRQPTTARFGPLEASGSDDDRASGHQSERCRSPPKDTKGTPWRSFSLNAMLARNEGRTSGRSRCDHASIAAGASNHGGGRGQAELPARWRVRIGTRVRRPCASDSPTAPSFILGRPGISGAPARAARTRLVDTSSVRG